MGTYHFLINHTKKEVVDFDGWFKGRGQWKHKSEELVDYLFDNEGDQLQFIPDSGEYDEFISDGGYKERCIEPPNETGGE